ncbi:MAG TPA: amidase domain-containing protein [Firmicutes bacterium]|jgi:hypothetical protein|nr:amidase domain-containing protein [Bacillota bacterium]HOQ24466.1 amidase domain-containing protein [Bacillota bacterium]HPT68181.1 amidase domain-containing protein [Bacillota bacterium]
MGQFPLLNRRIVWLFFLFSLILLGFCATRYLPLRVLLPIPCTATEIELSQNEAFQLFNGIFRFRNNAICRYELAALATLYDRSTLYGSWAYEHQAKKVKYLRQWCNKQGVRLITIESLIRLNKVTPRGNILRVTLLASTEYKYSYYNEPDRINLMRLGSYHSLDLIRTDETWKIVREWYTDPFADSLRMDEAQVGVNQAYILQQKPRDFTNLHPRRLAAVAYADEFCGAANDAEKGFKYNTAYKNYNYSGGDCTNFASQILHEGGGLPKTALWNYGKDGSPSWVNARAFNNYMLNSGRATRLCYGAYDQVLKASYQLLPGDYIAYEKKGKVSHISVVTGADSKGYTLVNSHNADRYRVPWDLGWSDRGIKFHLVRVHY